MDAHPLPMISTLREISSGGGGRTLVISGIGPGKQYSGLHRAPADSLLEAVLTFVERKSYEEIVLIAGRGGHLPDMPVSPLVRLSASRAIVCLKKSPPAAAPVRQDSPPPAPRGAKYLGNDLRRGEPTAGMLLDDAGNLTWRDRLLRMFDWMDRWSGVSHVGVRTPTSSSHPKIRRLIVLDAEFLIPDEARWHEELVREERIAGDIPARFARLPQNIKDTPNDLILLTRNPQESGSLEGGNLILRRLPTEAQKVEQFRLQWTNVGLLTIPPPSLSPTVEEYYPALGPEPLTHFQRTVPVKPRLGRVVPLEKMTADDIFRGLCRNIVGQDETMRRIAGIIERNIIMRSADSTKPIASFLFPGPTGSGKTETAKALALALFGRTEERFVNIKMEAMKETVQPLLGLVPGFVGFTSDMQLNGGGELTKPLIRNPGKALVILLDELEKAHHDAPEVLFSILDEGQARDASSNHRVSFRDTVLIVTTNSAEGRFSALAHAGASWDALRKDASRLLGEADPVRWSNPFLARFDGIFPLCYPQASDLLKIAERYTRGLLEVDGGHRVVTISPEFLTEMLNDYNPRLGIRNLQETIKSRLGDQLVEFKRMRRTGLSLEIGPTGGLTPVDHKENDFAAARP